MKKIVAVLEGDRRRPVRPASFVDMAIRHRVAPLLVSAGATTLLPWLDVYRIVRGAGRWFRVKN